MNVNRPGGLLLSVLLIFFGSCKGPKEEPVTKEEARTLAVQIQKTILNKQDEAFDDFFIPEVLAERIAGQTNQNKNTRAMSKGIGKALKNVRLGDQIIMALGKEGFYELVKQYEKDGMQHLIFRLYGDGGLNYHDFELTKLKKKTGIADMNIYLSGENISKTLGNFFDFVSGEEKKTGNTDESMKKMAEIKSLMNMGDYEKAHQKFEELPATYQEQRMFQVLNIQICSELDEEIYLKALNKFEAKYSGDPAMSLTMIDAYFLKKDYPKALEAVNRLDKLIDKDPFLDYYRGLLYEVMEKKPESLSSYEKLMQYKPDFADGAVRLILAYISTENKEKARAAIAAYKKNKDFDQKKLEDQLILYPEYNN